LYIQGSSFRDSNNKHFEEEKDKHLDQREQVGKNKGKIFFLGLYQPRNMKNIFILLTDRPTFSHNLPVEQQIKFVSSKHSLMHFSKHLFICTFLYICLALFISTR